MNKQDLKAKWSKYCDTDKLFDDMMALLKDYGHRHTEHGVCALLDEYFTNKESLIQLLSTSKNYIGNLRISLDKEFERKLDANEIRNFFRNIGTELSIDKLVKAQDSEGKIILDYMPTGKLIFDLNELPTDEARTERMKKLGAFDFRTGATTASIATKNKFIEYLNYFREIFSSTIPRDYSYDGVELKSGTKTSRAFNKVCAHYGVDKFEKYNKVFAQYADLVSGLVRKKKFIISVNPLDYLTMSFGVSWRSCHCIDGGGYQGGCLSYMLDQTSMVTFVIDNLDGEIHRTPKLYRQMVHYGNDLFVQNRLYPQGNDGATNLYDKFRDFVVEEFSTLLGVSKKWKVECGRGTCDRKTESEGIHYKDYLYNNSCNVFYPEERKTKISDYVVTIGHKGICTHCGEEYTHSSRLAHSSCRVCTEEEVFDWD
jgi:hypothetical protein